MAFSEESVQFFAKHLVNLSCYDRTPGERASANQGQGHYINITCTVISVSGVWFLLTAGHCIEEVDQALRGGQKFENWHLDDTVPAAARDMNPVPFHFDRKSILAVWDKDVGYDFACIPIPNFYRRSLEANGIVAVDERAWHKELPSTFETFVMLGVPQELVVTDGLGGTISKGYAMIRVQQITDVPPAIPYKNSLFYGQLPDKGTDGMSLGSIVGMSGGPIFGFARDAAGALRYWLVAIQSLWYPEDRVTRACYTLELGNLLEDLLVDGLADDDGFYP